MNWNILGIEPTKDKKAITAAYRMRLRQTNPEDKPEEFKALRAAYEEALSLANKEETAAPQDNSPVGRWTGALAAIYSDFASRINPEKWRSLLYADVCLALDTRPAVEEALLSFLTENYYIPRSVMSLIDEAFGFNDRIEELQEHYSREFLDNVIVNGTKLDSTLPYELFEPGVNGADCDRYIQLYFQMGQEPIEQIGELLEQLDKLSEKHPYGELLRIHFRKNMDESLDISGDLQKLAEAYPSSPVLAVEWAAQCMEKGDLKEARRISERILEEHPDFFRAKDVLSKCFAGCGEYDKAKELIFECVRSSGSEPILANYCLEQLKQWNTELIPLRKAKMAADLTDTDNIIELAWCYIQNDQIDDAARVAAKIDAVSADVFKYHNLMGKLNLNQQDFAEALYHFERLENYLKGTANDGTKEIAKRLARLPEVLQLEGSCLMQMERNEEARVKFEEALQIAPEDLDVLILMGKILYATGDHEYAVQILERVIQLSPNRWHAHLLMAMNLYRLHRDREAFDAVNRGLVFQSSDLVLYILKLQILIRNGAWEEVHATLDFLRESGAPEDISIEFVEAQLTEFEKKNQRAAFAQYQKIARRVEAGEVLMWAPELYYRMALLMSDSMNMDSEEDRELLLAMLDKGLDHYEQDQDCLAYKAWLLDRGGKLQEAIGLYRAILEKNSHSTAAHHGLSELYYSHLAKYAQEALEYYEELLSVRKSAELYFYAASAKRQLGDLEGARRYYLMEMETDPDDVDAYNGLAYICDAEGRYEDSLAYLDQALDIMKRLDKSFMFLFDHKVQVLRRLSRFEEALATVNSVMSSYDFFAGHQLKFDICCQWGKWEQAKKVIAAWKKAMRSDSALMQAKGSFYLLTGKLFRASLAMWNAKKELSEEDALRFQLQLAELACNYEQQIDISRHLVKSAPDSDYAYIGFARALYWGGKKDQAAEAAQKALELLDEVLGQSLTDEALYRSRRSLALAILGRSDEAKEELKRTRGLPLCEHCPYGSCKDADIYEAEIEEIIGNNAEALRMFRAGRTQWPDDLDFAVGEARCRRKGT